VVRFQDYIPAVAACKDKYIGYEPVSVYSENAGGEALSAIRNWRVEASSGGGWGNGEHCAFLAAEVSWN
jgi:hypothetical protein